MGALAIVHALMLGSRTRAKKGLKPNSAISTVGFPLLVADPTERRAQGLGHRAGGEPVPPIGALGGADVAMGPDPDLDYRNVPAVDYDSM